MHTQAGLLLRQNMNKHTHTSACTHVHTLMVFIQNACPQKQTSKSQISCRALPSFTAEQTKLCSFYLSLVGVCVCVWVCVYPVPEVSWRTVWIAIMLFWPPKSRWNCTGKHTLTYCELSNSNDNATKDVYFLFYFSYATVKGNKSVFGLSICSPEKAKQQVCICNIQYLNTHDSCNPVGSHYSSFIMTFFVCVQYGLWRVKIFDFQQ